MEEGPKPSPTISLVKEKNGEGEKQKTLVRKNRKEKRRKRTKCWAEKMQRFKMRQIEADVSRIRICLALLSSSMIRDGPEPTQERKRKEERKY